MRPKSLALEVADADEVGVATKQSATCAGSQHSQGERAESPRNMALKGESKKEGMLAVLDKQKKPLMPCKEMHPTVTGMMPCMSAPDLPGFHDQVGG